MNREKLDQLRERIYRELEERMVRLGLNKRDLCNIIGNILDLSPRTINSTLRKYMNCWLPSMPSMSERRELSPDYPNFVQDCLERVAATLYAVKIEAEHETVLALKSIYGNSFVYPPRRESASNMPLSQRIEKLKPEDMAWVERLVDLTIENYK